MRRLRSLVDVLVQSAFAAAVVTRTLAPVIVVTCWILPMGWRRVVALSPLAMTMLIPVGLPLLLRWPPRGRWPRARSWLVLLVAAFVSQTFFVPLLFVVELALAMFVPFWTAASSATLHVTSTAIVFVSAWLACAAMNRRIGIDASTASNESSSLAPSRNWGAVAAVVGSIVATASWIVVGADLPTGAIRRENVHVSAMGTVEVQSLRRGLDGYICRARLRRGGHPGPWIGGDCSPDSGGGPDYQVWDLGDEVVLRWGFSGLVRIGGSRGERVDAMPTDRQAALLARLIRSRGCELAYGYVHTLAYHHRPEDCRVLRELVTDDAPGARSSAPACESVAAEVSSGMFRCGQ